MSSWLVGVYRMYLKSHTDWRPRRIERRVLMLSATLISLLSVAIDDACAQQNFLSLSSGSPPPLTNVNAVVANGGPGTTSSGLPPDVANFTTSADLGDLSMVTNGAPAQVIVGFRVRGDVPFSLMVSQIGFQVSNLQYRGVDLSGSQDRGSFIRMTAGTPAAVGARGNAAGTSINGALAGAGLFLSQVATGPVNGGASTVVATGQSPTRESPEPSPAPGSGVPQPSGIPASGNPENPLGTTGGAPGMQSGVNAAGSVDTASGAGAASGGAAGGTTGNTGGQPAVPPGTNRGARDELSAVDIPVFFWFPTGLALGPTDGTRPGIFSANLQFGVFPRP